MCCCYSDVSRSLAADLDNLHAETVIVWVALLIESKALRFLPINLKQVKMSVGKSKPHLQRHRKEDKNQ